MKTAEGKIGEVSRLSNDDVPAPLKRMRRLAWLLDRSFAVGGYRIGLDPIIGLLPGVGDVIGGGLSIGILFDAARLGIPVRVLVRMVGNVMVELVVGVIPFLGDVFDFAWRANVRNLELVERHFDSERAQRPVKRIAWLLVAIMAALIVGSIVLLIMLGRVLLHAIT